MKTFLKFALEDGGLALCINPPLLAVKIIPNA